jgi:hypothetical protein
LKLRPQTQNHTTLVQTQSTKPPLSWHSD